MPSTLVSDVMTVLARQARIDASAAAGNTTLSKDEQARAARDVADAAQEIRDDGGRGTRVTVDAIETKIEDKARALIGTVNQSSGTGAQSLSHAEAVRAWKTGAPVGESVLRAYEVASGNGINVDAIAALHVNGGLGPDAVFHTFASEDAATRHVDPDSRSVLWLVPLEDSLLKKSYVSGRNDLWAQRFEVDRLTGVLTVTHEH